MTWTADLWNEWAAAVVRPRQVDDEGVPAELGLVAPWTWRYLAERLFTRVYGRGVAWDMERGADDPRVPRVPDVLRWRPDMGPAETDLCRDSQGNCNGACGGWF